jgi:hypothetical protein
MVDLGVFSPVLNIGTMVTSPRSEEESTTVSRDDLTGVLEVRRRSRCELVCDTGRLATPIQWSSLRPHTGGSTP